MVQGSDLLAIDSLDAALGDEVVVSISAQAPGLGAWTFDVQYDTSTLTFVSCLEPDVALAPGTPACTALALGRLHVTGVSADGLESEVVLAQLVFRCDAAGTADLTANVDVWSRATVAVPEAQSLPPEVQNGSITCTEPDGPSPVGQLPATGAGPVTSTPTLITPLLAAIVSFLLLTACLLLIPSRR